MFSLFRSSSRDRVRTRRPRPFRPRLETLDDRTLPSTLVSINAAGTDSGNAGSGGNMFDIPQVSDDGNHVAFFSEANDLTSIPVTTGVTMQVGYVRNLSAGETKVIAIKGTLAAGSIAGLTTFLILGDGSRAVFQSSGHDIAGGHPGSADIFLRDLAPDGVSLIAPAPTPDPSLVNPGTEPSSLAPVISPNGRYVAFLSQGNEEIPTHLQQHFYVVDLQTNAYTRVDAGTPGYTDLSQCVTGGTYAFSGDSSTLVFISPADGLVANDTNGKADVFAYDLATHVTTLVSVNADGTNGGNGASGTRRTLDVSHDGRFVLFGSNATDLTPSLVQNANDDVYVRDLELGTTTLLSVNAADTVSGGSYGDLSEDGRYAVFHSSAALFPNLSNDFHIYRADVQTGALELVDLTVSGTAGGALLVGRPVSSPGPHGISGDGRFITFISNSSGLVANFVDANGGGDDVFVRDMLLGVTTLLSNSGTGAATGGNKSSYYPSISNDGSRVAFFSDAFDLGPNDTNGKRDVYLADVPRPEITITNPQPVEGDSGTRKARFTVRLSEPSRVPVSVDVETADGTAHAGVDYTALAPTTLTFNPGETSKVVNVTVAGDLDVEAHERFFLRLSNPVHATLAVAKGRATIRNDDTTLCVGNVSLLEGDAGTTAFVFEVRLAQPSALAVSVDFRTANGTAQDDGDYVGRALTTLVFNPGETRKLVTVQVRGDEVVESDEWFFVKLSNAVNAAIADGQGRGTIRNDDAA